ncbi:MAG: class I adenylate cyclase, partial [Myxococcota bacterium]|nr:class I adenylate cyclase [Myxococcota bacterium]
ESDLLHRFFESVGERYENRTLRVCVALYLSIPMVRKRPGQTPRAVYLARQLGRRWGWDERLMGELDDFRRWVPEKIDALMLVLRDFVLSLYQRMSLFAEKKSIPLNETQDILCRRRISACFESMEGKVPFLFTSFLGARKSREEKLTFVESKTSAEARRWQLFREQGGRPLFVAESLPFLCVWAVTNGYFTPHTAVTLASSGTEHNVVSTRALLHRLHELLGVQRSAGLPDQHFSRPPQTKRLLLSISPSSFEEEISNSYAPQGWDILNYGQRRQSQLTDISLITYNSWGEIFCRRYLGPEAFPTALLQLYGVDGSRLRLDRDIEVLGPNDRAQPMVRKRIEEVFRGINEVVTGAPGVRRVMAYEVGGQYQIFSKGEGRVRISEARSLRGLVRHLSTLSEEPQELFIDPLSPSLRELGALVRQHQADENAKVYVAWRQQERLGHVIICDERRRVFLQQCSALETRLTLVRTVRRLLPHLRKQVGSARELQQALRVFQFQDGRLVAGKGASFSEATSQVLGALSKAKTGGEGLWLVGSLADGRKGLGLQYGEQEFWASRYGASFVYACVKYIIEQEGLQDPESWTLDGSKVEFSMRYRGSGVGAIQQLRLISIYQREITKALNYILQHQMTTA